METRVENAAPEHFRVVHERLLRPLNDAIPEMVWRRLFEQPWAREDDPTGQILFHGDEPVGYAGFVHGWLPRPDGTHEHLVNLTTWVVDPEHRQAAPSLIMPVLRFRDATITSLTNIPPVAEMLGRLGFRELETGVCRLRPVAMPGPSWRPAEVLLDRDAIMERLPEPERTIAREHDPYVRHLLLLGEDGRHCYAMLSPGRWRRIPTAKVRWITPGILADASIALRRAVLRHFRAPLLELDARMVPPSVPGVLHSTMAVPRMFRSARLEAADVPGAYSELVLLDL